MISGIVMSLTVIWVYQTLLKAKTKNLLLWVCACGALFLGGVFLMYIFCNEFVDIMEKDIGDQYDPSLTDVRDRKTQEGPGGVIMPFLCELLPSVVGFFAVAFLRTQVILKQSLTPANIFSGIKEMFVSIKDSFTKTSD
jgi:hypothetical protein